MIKEEKEKEEGKETPPAKAEKTPAEIEAAEKKLLEEKETASKKTSPGQEEPKPKTSDNDDVFKAGYGKGGDKRQKDLWKQAGCKNEEEWNTLCEAREKKRLEEQGKRGSGDLAAENERLRKQLATREERDEEEWKGIGADLKKAQPKLYAALDSDAIPMLDRIRAAKAALGAAPSNGRRKVGGDALNPGEEQVSAKMLEWFKRQFPQRHAQGHKPNKDDIAAFNHKKNTGTLGV